MAVIRYVSGDIFDSSADCIVNPVNCIGVMGKGLALQFKRRYPKMFTTYKMLCDKNLLRIGQVAFFRDTAETQKVVCLFPTKYDWRNPSRVEYIDSSLHSFIKIAPEFNISSVAFPMVGCGEGGLNFIRQVKPLLELRLNSTKFDVEVYV